MADSGLFSQSAFLIEPSQYFKAVSSGITLMENKGNIIFISKKKLLFKNFPLNAPLGKIIIIIQTYLPYRADPQLFAVLNALAEIFFHFTVISLGFMRMDSDGCEKRYAGSAVKLRCSAHGGLRRLHGVARYQDAVNAALGAFLKDILNTYAGILIFMVIDMGMSIKETHALIFWSEITYLSHGIRRCLIPA